MPCDSSHMEPDQLEVESNKVALFIVYVARQLGLTVEPFIAKAAREYYGDRDNCDRLTARLCALLTAMPASVLAKVVYNARNKTSRALADWWEAHKKADKQKRKDETTDAYHSVIEEAMERAKTITDPKKRVAAMKLLSKI